MRPIVVVGLRTVLGCCALLVAACGGSTAPRRDTVPPVADVSLSVGRSMSEDDDCPMMAFFNLNPMGSSDETTARDDLEIRWDFDNSGTWDTSYERLVVRAVEPDPLPIGEWTVRCEVRDQAGNTDIVVESIELPAWLPVPDDVIAGKITFTLDEFPLVSVDTLRIGQPFGVTVWHKDWVTPAGQSMQISYFIDGVLVNSGAAETYYPSRRLCQGNGTRIASGISTPGLHEIQVVLDAGNNIAESNEDNNTTVQSVVVIE